MSSGYFYAYPKADHAVDIVIVHPEEDRLKLLLIRRGRKGEPFYNCWALPGGYVNEGETVERAALREAGEETGLRLFSLQEIGTFSEPDRDPRGRVISTGFLSVVTDISSLRAGDDAADARWLDLEDVSGTPLAFDHLNIIRVAVSHMGRVVL
jgi:8-oxo-dGTP diphosphatase